jgi:hypothetical protein
MESTPSAGDKPSTSDRLKALIAEWGMLFFFVWFGLFGIVLVGFALAIKFGLRVESTAGTWGTWGAAWVATQLTKPLRFGATLVITPALGALLKRFRRPRPADSLAGGASSDAGPPAGRAPVAPAGTPLDETPSGQG